LIHLVELNHVNINLKFFGLEERNTQFSHLTERGCQCDQSTSGSEEARRGQAMKHLLGLCTFIPI